MLTLPSEFMSPGTIFGRFVEVVVVVEEAVVEVVVVVDVVEEVVVEVVVVVDVVEEVVVVEVVVVVDDVVCGISFFAVYTLIESIL